MQLQLQISLYCDYCISTYINAYIQLQELYSYTPVWVTSKVTFSYLKLCIHNLYNSEKKDDGVLQQRCTAPVLRHVQTILSTESSFSFEQSQSLITAGESTQPKTSQGHLAKKLNQAQLLLHHNVSRQDSRLTPKQP